MKAVLLISLLVFGLACSAEVNFVEYVKRNYKILKKSGNKPEVTAFKEINPYRGVASIPPENQAPSPDSGSDAGSAASNSEQEAVTPASADGASSESGTTEQGPNK